ncbi:MAG: nitrate reductase associated protein [Chitinophagaceae bacterium]
MKKKEKLLFKKIVGVEYFNFEEDFVEKNIRCIPMIVRFKMDKAGIKLKLAEWSRFSTAERIELATKSCGDEREAKLYHQYLAWVVERYTESEATGLAIDENPGWTELKSVPGALQEKSLEFGWSVSTEQWSGLTDLQRFALLKLCRPGHESKNFPKAMKEFDLTPIP